MSQITNFPITVYGKKEKFSDTMTRGRCRVFYKGHNRNGTYITNEKAKKLIERLPSLESNNLQEHIMPKLILFQFGFDKEKE